MNKFHPSAIMMAIADGLAGRRKHKRTEGAGVWRARERINAERMAQAERLKDAKPPIFTRQQRRAADRHEVKRMSMTPTQEAYLNMHGKMPIYPTSTFVNGV